jgi:cytochrome c-type biogenesis protein CcmH
MSKRSAKSFLSLSYTLLAGVMAIALGLFMAPTVYAQESTPTQTAPTNVSLDEVNAVASEIWCPLCSGVRLDACELKACAQMKDVIAIKLSEGEDTDSIRDYFVAQYGPQVLGEPPWDRFWIAWVLPFVVLAIGGYFLWHTMRRMVRKPVSVATASAPTSAATPEDEYGRQLAEELKRYG